MAGVAVVTDSTSSISPAEVLALHLTVVPLQVVIDGISRSEAPGQATPAVVAAALRAHRKVSTSRPSPAAFAAAYAELAEQGFDAVVSAHLSGEISGTYEAAATAAGSAPVGVTVVDTRTLAMAAGFGILSGAELAARGGSAGAVADLIRRRAAASTIHFMVDTLEHLRRGGRIGAGAALLGSALAVKPLLTIADGQIRPLERVRTTSRALARLADLATAALARAAGTTDVVDVAVHHLDNRAGAERLVERLADRVRPGGRVEVAELSAVLGVHVGPGTLGVVVSPRL